MFRVTENSNDKNVSSPEENLYPPEELQNGFTSHRDTLHGSIRIPPAVCSKADLCFFDAENSDVTVYGILNIAAAVGRAKNKPVVVLMDRNILAFAAAAITFLVPADSRVIFVPLENAKMVSSQSSIARLTEHMANEQSRGCGSYIYADGQLYYACHFMRDIKRIESFSDEMAEIEENRSSFKLTENIEFVRVTPFTTRAELETVLRRAAAVVLAGYGTGNIPLWMVDLIRKHERCTVVIVSQCTYGLVKADYEAAAMLARCSNVILGGSMTAEAAVAKLSYIIGNYGPQYVERLFPRNLRGELCRFISEDG